MSRTALPLALALVGLIGLSTLALAARRPAPAGPQLAHMVFFTLKDQSPEAVAKFVASTERNLSPIEGTTYFSVGTIAKDSDEGAVSVKDFDVALHAVFQDKETKEKYLVDPRHKKFVEENKDQFAKVRVFDSYLNGR